jgi:hypothetical protein
MLASFEFDLDAHLCLPLNDQIAPATSKSLPWRNSHA